MTRVAKNLTKDFLLSILLGVLVLLLLSLCGCRTPLDDRQNELIETWGAGNKAFAEVIQQYQKVTDEAAANYHDLQGESVKREFSRWVDTHTDEFGGLVYVDESGQIKPMPAAKMLSEIEKRDAALTTIVESKHRWGAVQSSVSKAVDDFVLMTHVSLSSNADIAQAKRSAQQFIDSALVALSTVATGAAVAGG